jgi:hypothetical protein
MSDSPHLINDKKTLETKSTLRLLEHELNDLHYGFMNHRHLYIQDAYQINFDKESQTEKLIVRLRLKLEFKTMNGAQVFWQPLIVGILVKTSLDDKEIYALKELSINGTLNYGSVNLKVIYLNDFQTREPIAQVDGFHLPVEKMNYLLGFNKTHELVAFFTAMISARS